MTGLALLRQVAQHGLVRLSVPHQQAHRGALYHPIHDRFLVERLAQQRSALIGGDGHAKDAPFHALGQFARRPGMEQLALVQQIDDVAPFGLVEISGGPKHADAFADQILYHVPQFAPRHRVDADAGLVEQQQLWLLQQGAGEAELLLHAAGELAGQPVLEPFQIGELQQPVEARLAVRADQVPQIRHTDSCSR